MTDRKNIQEALHKAVEARDTFLGIASHELRTPLTSLMLQSQMHQRNIERQGAAAVTLERMQRIIDSTVTQTTRLARLVDDMLDVSRISSGKLSTRRERLNLSELALDTLSRFKPQLEAAGCVVNCNVAPDVLVDGDVFRLEQVVTNLLTNAVKYAPGKPVDLSVQVRGQRVELKLRDHGAGIRKEHLERIFERFERFESASNVSGLGLGLHISREIVRAHGGEIYAESDLGHGAEFTVVLHAFVAA